LFSEKEHLHVLDCAPGAKSAIYNFRYLARSANLPEGLYILPSVIYFFISFFIFFNDFSETNYLKIRWTNFRNLYVE